MDARTVANRYYEAWTRYAGDMSGVPLAADFVFTGPVASFDTAEGYRAMARQAGAAVRDFRVRHGGTGGAADDLVVTDASKRRRPRLLRQLLISLFVLVGTRCPPGRRV